MVLYIKNLLKTHEERELKRWDLDSCGTLLLVNKYGILSVINYDKGVIEEFGREVKHPLDNAKLIMDTSGPVLTVRKKVTWSYNRFDKNEFKYDCKR